MYKQTDSIRVSLPDWLQRYDLPTQMPVNDMEAAMSLAIHLSDLNVRHRTGGPFGALVLNLNHGQLISAAVNCVEAQCCSSAHAEIMALSLAQQRMGQWNLAETQYSPLTLITSCEPCAMCLGAIPWSGVSQIVCGATKADAESAGFDEGARPNAWKEALLERGIDVVTEVCRAPAAKVLQEYAESGQTIYNP